MGNRVSQCRSRPCFERDWMLVTSGSYELLTFQPCQKRVSCKDSNGFQRWEEPK